MPMFYAEVFEAMAERGVRFVVVGGTATILHGVPRMTADLDLVVDLGRPNVEALVSALGSLGYQPRVPVNPTDLGDPDCRRAWFEEKAMMALSFWHPARPLDAVDILYAGPLDYGSLAERAVHVTVGDMVLSLASIADLITMKEGTGRAQDAADVDALRRLRDAQEGH